jgi:hypothetical protein
MKTKKKNGRGLYLQTSNNRWKWMAGATAATAAGVTASQASAITINLVGNYISALGGNHLNADLTGDGHPDLVITGANASRHFHYIGTSTRVYDSGVGAILNGIEARAWFYGDGGPIGEALGSKQYSVRYRGDPSTLTGSIPVFFKDLHINGGTPTIGSLEVTVFSFGPVDVTPTIQLDSLTYNTPGQGSRPALAVPDQGSSLALLAMGAGGILALRRWRTAQGRS